MGTNRPIFLIFIVIAMCVISISFVSCSEDDDDDDVDSQMTILPIKAGIVWDYRVIPFDGSGQYNLRVTANGYETFEGKSCFKTTGSSTNHPGLSSYLEYDYLVIDTDRIRTFVNIVDSVNVAQPPVTYRTYNQMAPPMLLYPSKADIDSAASWSESGTQLLQLFMNGDLVGAGSGNYSITVTYLGRESKTTQAGRFADCYKLKCEYYDSSGSVIQTRTSWVHEQTGLVYRLTNSIYSNIPGVEELTAVSGL